jgi:hypothetical protein
MLSARAFRAQLANTGQRQLFDYWRRSAGRRRMPARSDLDPVEVPKLLPHLGLIDVRKGMDQACFSLTGTRWHDIYGQEITGKRIADVFSGDCAEYWRGIHARVVVEGLPLHGVVRGPADGRDHVVLCWLRLPLSEDGGRVDRILCHDTKAEIASERLEPDLSLLSYPRFRPDAASMPLQMQFG